MGFASGGYQSQESSQQQSSGLTPGVRDYFSNITPRHFGYARKRALDAEKDPGGLAYSSVVDQLLPIGKYGLPVGATEGVYQLGRDLFTQASGSRA